MRPVACVGYLALCLGLVGCNAFGRKQSAAPAGSGAAPAAPAATDRPALLGANGPVPPGDVGGILAGQVVDSYNRRPPVTYIRVVAPDETAAKTAPIEVTTDGQGYFTIQGLRPGRHYQLIARASDGEHMMAGTTWVTPPDPKVLIRISEDFATENTPPIPPPPVTPRSAPTAAPPPQWPDKTEKTEPPPKPAEQPAPAEGTGAEPAKTNAIPPRRAAEIGPPVKDPVPAPPQSHGSGDPAVRAESIAQDPRALAQRNLLSVPAQVPREEPSAAVIAPRPSAPAAPATPAVPTRVPSCVLTGRQLNNFALYDLRGQPWEFRNRRGRLVLLDFWGTWCVYCVQSIPTLNILQERYGPYGLEVVGIAYEQGTFQQQVQKVERIQGLKRVNYRLLLGGGEECPVREQFGIQHYPTHILLDENGRIIWKGEGGLDQEKLHTLEQHIRKKLNVR